MPISAGVRPAYVRLVADTGRRFIVDISGVPEEKRAALVAEIRELVNRAGNQ